MPARPATGCRLSIHPHPPDRLSGRSHWRRFCNRYSVRSIAGNGNWGTCESSEGIGGCDHRSEKAMARYTLFNAKAPTVMRNLMRDFGFTLTQAAGILGNIGHECAGFTQLQERNPHGGRGGYGWCQWTGPRRRNFESWCAEHRLRERSDRANYGFLVYEMTSTPERRVVRALRRTRTLRSAVATFEQVYERAGTVNLSSRIQWARRALRAYRLRWPAKFVVEIAAERSIDR